MTLFTNPRHWFLFAIFAGVFATTVQATTSPITITTFRANNGEMIIRNRTVTLTLSASSSAGSITAMELGDSIIQKFNKAQPYKKSLSYTLTGTANGLQMIAVRFLDSKGNVSDQASANVDIVPNFQTLAPLSTGTTLSMSLRHGVGSWTQLQPAVSDTDTPIVNFSTAEGDILMQLTPAKAPLTVANFLEYVKNDAFDYSFIHRSVPGFVIQGGGWYLDLNNNNTITKVASYGTVPNEFGTSNTRGTIAMALTGSDTNSATSEWFVNLVDNSASLDPQKFTVFGKVLDSSMPVVDTIAGLPVTDQTLTLGAVFNELPLMGWTSGQQLQVQNLVLVYSTTRFVFTVIQQIPGVLATINKTELDLTPSGKATSGTGSIIIRAATLDGRILDFPVVVDVNTYEPMLNGGLDKTVSTKVNTPVDIPIPVSNPENSPLTWNLSVPTTGSCALLPVVDPNTRTVHYTPQLNFTGTDTFTIQVTGSNADPQKVGTDKITVTVIIPHVPMLNRGLGKTVIIKENTPIDIPIPVSNPNNSPLTWNLSTPTTGSCSLLPIVKSNTCTVHYTPKLNFFGTDTFTLQVTGSNTDPQKFGTDKITVTVIVQHVNQLPTIIAPVNFPVVGGTTATFGVTVGDVETSATNLQLTCVSNNPAIFSKGSIILGGTGTARTVQLIPSSISKSGTATLTLTVTDGDRGRNTAKVLVPFQP